MKILRRSVAALLLGGLLLPQLAWADGKVVPPRDYKGSLEEKSQEAIIIFHSSQTAGEATEDLILKIQVEGDATEFAWVVPFPNEPEIAKEENALFEELFNYVEARTRRSNRDYKGEGAAQGSDGGRPTSDKVEVISRKIVGDFDIAVVRENEEGGLNPWLEKEGFQKLEDAEDVLKFYRDKGYVFACMKVSSEALASEKSIESHPLRFTFKTGGRDGVYFPMKMTGLQTEPFDVNLYVFYRAWLNDKLSPFGYKHRGFFLRFRDYDSPKCKANAGKAWSLPEEDPYLAGYSGRLRRVRKLFQKLHPGEKYYLTNIQCLHMQPDEVRAWKDDLWLFPYYTNRNMVPYDARKGGAAHDAYPNVEISAVSAEDHGHDAGHASGGFAFTWFRAVLGGVAALVVVLAAVSVGLTLWRQRRAESDEIEAKPVPKKP